MTALLLMGLLIGMRHALEADHLAALASLCSRKQSLNQAIRLGVVWGVGHTLTLLLFGSAVILMGYTLSPQLGAALETAVGCMLVLLGVDLLRRLLRHKKRIRARAKGSDDRQPYAGRFPMRPLLVGLMHGMAGSAALTVLALQTVETPLAGMAYILLFGMGSILGMALVSMALTYPLRRLERG